MSAIVALGVAAQVLATQSLAADPAPVKADLATHWEPPVLHTTALLIGLRHAEGVLYPDPFADGNLKHIFERYRDTFTKPPIFDSSKPFFEWDGDPWTINVIGHGLLGSELYVRARICHFGWAGSLAFAAFSTVAWEYVFEGSGVRPSVLDLIYTPLGGLVIGEARYIAFRGAQSIASPAFRAIFSALVDPFGELERKVMASPC